MSKEQQPREEIPLKQRISVVIADSLTRLPLVPQFQEAFEKIRATTADANDVNFDVGDNSYRIALEPEAAPAKVVGIYRKGEKGDFDNGWLNVTPVKNPKTERKDIYCGASLQTNNGNFSGEEAFEKIAGTFAKLFASAKV